MTRHDLFGAPALPEGLTLLPGLALPEMPALLAALAEVTRAAPFRHMVTRGGFRMSVAMTSCGALGWISDRAGYRYAASDPATSQPWPAMPDAFATLATRAAAQAGFADFAADSCLVNRYAPGAKMAPHQDRDERDFTQPIVSVSLGLPATFLFGADRRSDPLLRIGLRHGDVVVWGGVARLAFHGIAALPRGTHPELGECRINLTFRRAR